MKKGFRILGVATVLMMSAACSPVSFDGPGHVTASGSIDPSTDAPAGSQDQIPDPQAPATMGPIQWKGKGDLIFRPNTAVAGSPGMVTDTDYILRFYGKSGSMVPFDIQYVSAGDPELDFRFDDKVGFLNRNLLLVILRTYLRSFTKTPPYFVISFRNRSLVDRAVCDLVTKPGTMALHCIDAVFRLNEDGTTDKAGFEQLPGRRMCDGDEGKLSDGRSRYWCEPDQFRINW